ncbi:hypothetical protein PsorP6_008266 [Peronosclerospora sorghi]|uniref:Uncharacterized protein n=1 Tax=Peronosclerospora sorghi TaxID=230839 RepID=A0ACC0WA70_9STRA|nr:hypothetical protein PsorP6_008266 [Peronosclerospora sorghi]
MNELNYSERHNKEEKDHGTDIEVNADVVDVLTLGRLSSCDHHFHFDCIVTWAKVTNLCPLCKIKFESVTRHDAQGKVHREVIKDTKQVHRPDPSDHDLAAQLRLINEARCELCGSGEDEHVLLLCDAVGCGVANHTYCIGLPAVPNSSWYCQRHALTQHRASDAIDRPSTTVSTRRRTRRLASLMSNVLRGQERTPVSRSRRRGTAGFVIGEEMDDRRPMRGIAAAYALRMSRELMQVQQRADAMFARGDLSQSSLYEGTQESAEWRSTVAASGTLTNQIWDDNNRRRQELIAAAIVAHDHGLGSHPGSTIRTSQRSDSVSKTFAPDYFALAKLMQDAVSSDNYASTVALSIPKTAKLRLVSRVKTYFARLNRKESAAAVELGCLSVLHQWIRVPDQQQEQTILSFNPQVLDAVLTILETLPIKKKDLVEEDGLQSTMDRLSELSDVSIKMRQRIIELSKKWLELNPPAQHESPRPQVRQPVSSPMVAAQHLPVITAFTSPRRTIRLNGKRKRKRDAYVKCTHYYTSKRGVNVALFLCSLFDTVVEYVKAKLYPLYNPSSGSAKLTRDRFKAIVKGVAGLFTQEASVMQSTVLLSSGELSNPAKSRVKKLIDQAYKETISKTSASISTASTPLLIHAGVLQSTYSAVPSIKHRR